MRGDLLALGVVAAAVALGRRGASATDPAADALAEVLETLLVHFELGDPIQEGGQDWIHIDVYPTKNHTDRTRLMKGIHGALRGIGFSDVNGWSHERSMHHMQRGEGRVRWTMHRNPASIEDRADEWFAEITVYLDRRISIGGIRSPWGSP